MNHTADESPRILQTRADRPVIKIGEQVRHPRQPWSESVHALLRYLNEAGFTEAPEPGPIEADHDDVSFIDGVSGDDACRLVSSDQAVAAVGSMLRRYHDLVAEWRPERELIWFDGRRGAGDPERGELVCHGDVGPWNLIWRGGRLVGLIDWEYATVGTRRQDIGYALHYLVPLRDRSYWHDVLGMRRKPQRHHRLSVFAEAYGISVDEQLVEDVLAAQRAGVQLMIDLASHGRLRQQQLIADGELAREQRAVLWGEGHRYQLNT